jgi:hypothetical protein
MSPSSSARRGSDRRASVPPLARPVHRDRSAQQIRPPGGPPPGPPIPVARQFPCSSTVDDTTPIAAAVLSSELSD